MFCVSMVPVTWGFPWSDSPDFQSSELSAAATILRFAWMLGPIPAADEHARLTLDL